MTELPKPLPQDYRAGYVAVVGMPNVGKSTLMNEFLDHKLSIVTRKPQTTRRSVLGILNEPSFQMIFIDTPGILNPQYDLQKAMMRYVEEAIKDADALLYLIDATKGRDSWETMREQLKNVKKSVVLGLNKIDLVDTKYLLPMIEALGKFHPFKAIIPLSALKKNGTDELIQELSSCLPFSPPFYPTDEISDQQVRFFVAEIIREKVFELYSDEIPYSSHVEIEQYKVRKKGQVYIEAVVLVEKDSQKGIVIGKGGDAIKRVGQSARRDIEAFIDSKVYLQLYVRVAPDWRKKENQLRKLGY